ncbi:hypothetical protein RCC89_12970 [Cytophagaceae bacterium ABcell3]|nr:hypothetical protein RCC89_12970 [Cytophagaceae bacterium ABcell3]
MENKDLVKSLLLLGLGTVGVGVAAMNKDKIKKLIGDISSIVEKADLDKTAEEALAHFKEACSKVNLKIEEYARALSEGFKDQDLNFKDTLDDLVKSYKANTERFGEKLEELAVKLAVSYESKKQELSEKIKKLITEYEAIMGKYEKAIEDLAKNLYGKFHIATTDDLKEIERRLRALENEGA